jgi:hypothetical protein
MKWILIAIVSANVPWAGVPEVPMAVPGFEERGACMAAGEAMQIMAKGRRRQIDFICAPSKQGATN